MLEERWYFSPPYTCREEVEEEYEIVSPSRLAKFEYCPYDYRLSYEDGLRQQAKPRVMLAGIAMHAALDYYYTTLDEEGALALITEPPWTEPEEWELLMWQNEKKGKGYLTSDHLRGQLKRYFHYWNNEATDTYPPIDPPKFEDLNMDKVIAAKLRMTEDGRVVLGESNVFMKFPFGELSLAIAGRPDLPIAAPDGRIYVMDHKTTSGWIGRFYWARFDADNKMKIYCAMVRELLGVSPNGYIINAICLNERTANDSFSGTRTARKRWYVTDGMIDEAIRNQYATLEMIKRCREMQWWPQWCDRCRHPGLCNKPVEDRAVMLNLEWEEKVGGFFDY